MPIEKTLDGRNIEFPEGYDTPEGRKRIVAERMPYSSDKEEYAVSFILARGIIKELGGDDKVWKDQNGEWKFSPSSMFQYKMKEVMPKVHKSTIVARARTAHPLFSDLWMTKEGGESNQTTFYENITTQSSRLWHGMKKLANPNDDNWTYELRQKCDEYFREIVNLLCTLISESGSDIELTSGQICYEAVAADEPAGKHITLARKVSCRLTLTDTNSDFEILANYGLAGLRRHRILRLTKEAYDQSALLSYEDLAILLTTSPSTVKRDIRYLKHDGKFVMTRGAKHDMGPGISHKTQIIELYLKGYQFTEIEQKTNHSERAVWRYLRDFSQVCILHKQGYPNAQIRIITNLSDRIIREYLQLLSEYSEEKNERVSQLLHPEQFFSKKKEY